MGGGGINETYHYLPNHFNKFKNLDYYNLQNGHYAIGTYISKPHMLGLTKKNINL